MRVSDPVSSRLPFGRIRKLLCLFAALAAPSPVFPIGLEPNAVLVATEDDLAFSLAHQAWNVVEKDLTNGHTWVATWTLRADGRSFDASWKSLHDGKSGSSPNFAHLQSISGGHVVVDRPGLGSYSGTLSADRRRISGKDSWCNCSWEVTLPEPLPASFK